MSTNPTMKPGGQVTIGRVASPVRRRGTVALVGIAMLITVVVPGTAAFASTGVPSPARSASTRDEAGAR